MLLHGVACRLVLSKFSHIKTKEMLWGLVPNALPHLTLGMANEEVQFVDSFDYVGMSFQLTMWFLFAKHYAKKAAMAEKNMYAIISLKAVVGDVVPWLGCHLYMQEWIHI